MKTQEKLFNTIKNQIGVIDKMASFVQNDYQMMLEDGYITKDGITDSIKEMKITFNNHIKLMYELRKKCEKMMQEVVKK